jgi:hypothetical protein
MTKTPVLEQQPSLALVGGSSSASNEAKPPAPTVKPPPVVSFFEAPAEVDDIMATILTWPRSHDSAAEKAFAAWLRSYITDDLGLTLREHAVEAFSVTIPRADGKPSAVLFTCHIDTVDLDKDSVIGSTKKLNYDPNFGQIFLDTSKDAPNFCCLGADDGAGIWIMLTMMAAKKPGTYLFHRGEECGGVSAKAIAKQDAAWLKTFDYAVAFDRPRDNEVITHQGGTRCASDKAALALCKALNECGMYYEPSNRGVYTDTKEYRGLIPECFNLGVGYQQQHSSMEVLDYAFCTALAGAAMVVDWDTLPVDRTPVIETYGGYDDYEYWGANWGGYGRSNRNEEVGKLAKSVSKDKNKDTKKPTPGKGTVTPTVGNAARWIEFASVAEILKECDRHPEDVAEAVIELVRKVHRLEADIAYLTTIVDAAIFDGMDPVGH